MGEILNFRLSSRHEQVSVYVPFDTTWSKLKSLLFTFLNVDYNETIRSISVVDCNNMDEIIATYDASQFNFQSLDLHSPGRELLFIVYLEGASPAIIPSPSAQTAAVPQSVRTSPSLTSENLPAKVSSRDSTATSYSELGLSSSFLLMNDFDQNTFKAVIADEVHYELSFETDKESPFLRMCADGNATSVESFFNDLPAGFNISVEGLRGLLVASKNGHASVVDILYQNGVRIESVDSESGMTALDLACLNNQQELVKWFADRKCDLSKVNKLGASPLHYVCYFSMLPLVSFITADNSYTVTGKGMSLLHYAAGVGSVQCVERLISVGADVNIWDNFGNSPLHYAAAVGSLETIFLLVEVGKCSVDCLNENGQTPFLIACRSGHHEVSKWLAGNKKSSAKSSRGGGGANIFIEDKEWRNALHAATLSANIELIEWLASSGLSIASKMKNGKSAIDIAPNDDVMECLRTIEAKMWAKDEKILEQNFAKEIPTDDFVEINSTMTVQSDIDIKLSGTESVEIEQSTHSVGLDSNHTYGSLDFPIDKNAENSGSELQIHKQSSDEVRLPSPPREADKLQALFDACINGDTVFVKQFVKNGGDVRACNQKGSQAIHFAAFGGHLDVIQILCEAGVDLEAVNGKGVGPMAVACSRLRPDDFWVVKWFAQQGVEVITASDKADYSTQPMYFVASTPFDCSELIKYLYETCPLVKYNIKQTNKSKEVRWSMLHTAAMHGAPENFKAFVDIGMKLSPVLVESLHTPLHSCVASDKSNSDMISLILSCCGYDDIVAVDNRGRTAIFLAALFGNLDAVKLIADAGFDSIRIRNISGNTCLHAACQSGDDALIKWLQVNYPDLNVANDAGAFPSSFMNAPNQLNQSTSAVDGKSLAHHVVLLRDGFNRGIVENLRRCAKSCDVISEALEINKSTQRPYAHDMACNGFLGALNYLIAEGLPLEVKDLHGFTILHCAVSCGQVNVVKSLILEEHFNVFETSESGSPCLHIAIRNKQYEMVEALIELGSDVNCQDLEGDTPLHVAASMCWLDMIVLLQENGADLTVKNGSMLTALHVLAMATDDDGDARSIDELGPVVNYLMSSGLDIDTHGKNRLTPFHLSCVNGNIPLCEFFYEHGANIMLYGGKDRLNTALHLAATSGQLDVVEWLVSHGLQYDAVNGGGRTPAEVAYDNGCDDVYEWLTTTAPTIYNDRFSECLLSELFWAMDMGYSSFANTILSAFLEYPMRNEICTDNGTSLLHVAANLGNLQCLQRLHEGGSELELITSDGQTPLHIACLHDKTSCVKFLVDLGCDAKTPDNEGNTCLHIVTERNNVDLCNALVSLYDSVDLQNNNGWTPLHYCCAYGESCEILNILLKAKANMFQFSLDDETPFYMACKNGHDTFVYNMVVHAIRTRLLVSSDILDNSISLARENGHDNISSWLEKVLVENDTFVPPIPDEELILNHLFVEDYPPDHHSMSGEEVAHPQDIEVVFEAINNGDVPYVSAILNAGYDVDSVSEESKMSALHVASLAGSFLVVQVLVKKGANLDIQNAGGLTPLHIACDQLHESIVSLLLHAGASLRKVCNNGNTALHLMACRSLSNSIYELQSYKKQLPDIVAARNNLGQSALHLAVVAGSLETCEALLTLGCPIDATDFDNQTPLLLACSIDSNPLVTLLVTRGANVNHENNDRKTALHFACAAGNLLVAHLLVDMGASVQTVSNSGDNLLHVCCKSGKLLLLKWLVKLGLDTTQRNSAGETPRDCAVCSKSRNVIAWLDSLN